MFGLSRMSIKIELGTNDGRFLEISSPLSCKRNKEIQQKIEQEH